MFWIMMYMILFGNSVIPELKLVPDETAIVQTVEDKTRLQTILSIHAEMTTQEDALLSFVREQYAELITLSREHSVDYDAFETILGSMDRERNSYQQALIDKRFRLKAQMTREEWEAVFKKK